MNLLLDTHVLLWWLADAPELPVRVRQAIAEPANVAVVSAASIWEVSIKAGQGRLEVPEDFVEVVRRGPIEVLDLSAEVAWEAGRLPLHHRDPFDRAIVAHARHLGATVVSLDPVFAAYDVAVLGH